MVARLPQPGGDNGNWGSILNEYLSQTLNADGLIKDNAITANTIAPNAVTNSAIATDAINATSIADGSITETLLAPAVQTKLNASAGAPDWSTITNKPAVIAAGADQAAARTAIGAGTGSSNLALGTTGSTAKAGNYQPAAANISDATTIGRSILTATDAAAVKASLSLNNVDNTSDATKNAATVSLTNKTISGSSNTFSDIPTSAISGGVAGSVNGTPTSLTLWTGTQAQYNALGSYDAHTIYAVTA